MKSIEDLSIENHKRAELKLQSLTGFSAAVGGLSVFAVLIGAVHSIQMAEINAETARENELAGRFASALALLDVEAAPRATVDGQADVTAARQTTPVGGMIALKTIVARSPAYQAPALRVLSSVIRSVSLQQRQLELQGRQLESSCGWLQYWINNDKPENPRLLPPNHVALEPRALEALRTLGQIRSMPAPDAEFVNVDPELKEAIDLSTTSLCIGYAKKGNFDFAWFRNANLSVATLDDSSFRCAGFPGAKLDGAHLVRADLRWADLRGATLLKTDVTDMKFDGANLAGANLEEIYLDDMSSHDLYRKRFEIEVNPAYGSKETKLPKGIIMPDNWKRKDAPDQADHCELIRRKRCGQ